MGDEHKAQNEPQDEVRDTAQRSTELSEAELDTVAGGLMMSTLVNISTLAHDTLKAAAQNLRG